ncbi:hypothetical protein GobsT_36710 [Gemmata obscuriglobus]|uniref:Glycosyltransferase RgtA/B/C/D-like domain-containing protein n=1 Tax=Gemmata obscuriglobus TaxID=114 RepID=A0A2Z3H3Q0_9BACT|nr:hypothetical protein [Gemmata obscuriglobus]AWM38216.1 hypothetical protein C1280_15290 [Gemmata obscuriglobus]QEG28883.1 hypothetical protein GobsT_36710 [Gemmata obscuriglobus]VTS07337.1 Uncharacterized protein OS=Smithella sp. SCADC GN=ER57_03855 PE=4 SV=1 [Gemmata obscuriglobus UQM 2246]
MKRLVRPETVFFLLTWLGLMVAFRDRGFYDPGALWHVKVGEIIIDRGMPQTDPFSYTFEGQRWVPQQWGAEVLMALAHRGGGLDAMLLGFATGVATLFALIFRRAVQGGMGAILAGLIVGGVLFVGAFHYFVRPHMFTIAFIGWTMMCVIDYERGRCTEWRLAGLIPLFIVWTNLHGGVLGGTMTLGLAVAGWGLVFLKSQVFKSQVPSQGTQLPLATPIRSWRTAFLLVAIVAACGLTPFVNPHGMEMIRIWQRIVASKVLPEVVNEHMPLDPSSALGLAVIGLGIFYLVLLAGALPRAMRVSWLVPLVWLVLSFKGIRQGPLFAVCAGVAIADLWQHTVWHRLLVKHGDGSTAWDTANATEAAGRRGPLWAACVLPVALVATAFTLQVRGVEAPVVGCGWARLDPDFVPSDLTREVTEYSANVPPGTPIFNDANLGGYLIYHAPRLKIFMDDRCELYGDDWIRAYSDALGETPEKLGPVFEGWAERYKFDRAIVLSNPPSQDKPPIEQYLMSATEKWREVSRGKRAVMFERVK